jgi:hypothetical protein
MELQLEPLHQRQNNGGRGVINIDINNRLVSNTNSIPLSFNGIYKIAVAVQRQRAIHMENSGFASPTLGQHISTFRGYRIKISFF